VESFQTSPWLVVLSLILLAILTVGFIFFAVSAQGGLIFAAKKLSRPIGKTDLKTAWREGMKKFWHLLIFNLLGQILIFILLFLAGLPVFLNIGGERGVGYLFSFISFLVFVPLALVVSFVMIYGLNYIVLKKADIREAFHESFSLFKNFWLQSLEFALIILGLNLLLVLAFGFIFLSLFLPFLILGSGLFLLFGVIGLWINVIILISLCFIVFVLVGSIFAAFQMVAWTLFYLKISKGKFPSKLFRILEPIFRK
jgi:hypothetical protein